MNDHTEPNKLSQLIIEYVEDMILSGQLKEGDRLPPERELTETLRVGRPALREALKALEVLGLLEMRHGVGNYVVNRVDSHIIKPLSLAFMLNNGAPEEILETRLLIEVFACRKAAQTATDQEIQQLRLLQLGVEQAESLDKKAQMDHALHNQIVQLSRNTLLRSFYDGASYMFDSFFGESVRTSDYADDSIGQLYLEHERIVDAIAAHDGDRAAMAIQTHLGNINLSLFDGR